MPENDQQSNPLPSVDALQFRKAQPVGAEAKSCIACKQPIEGEYFQVRDQKICPDCAAKIEAGKQNQQKVPLFRAVVYGVGAALAGCLLYAIVLAMGVQIGIVALAVGWMVGKAIRSGSYGMGGRPQQILAVTLTYFAISASLIPALFFIGMKQGYEARSTGKKQPAAEAPASPDAKAKPQRKATIAGFIALATISPFLMLASAPVGGLISLFILFIGLQRAWAMTARHEILVTGPYT
jgi:hypothetical protein